MKKLAPTWETDILQKIWEHLQVPLLENLRTYHDDYEAYFNNHVDTAKLRLGIEKHMEIHNYYVGLLALPWNDKEAVT